MLTRFLFTGRRRGGRRVGESERIYVDRPGPWIIAGFVVLVLLSGLDAAFTLSHLQHGATEANPLMRAALQLGDRAFVILKTVITVLAVGFLCLHKNWPLGRLCLALAILGYAALTAYHLYGHFMLT
jgi:hypothetical protein